ncbi:MAG: hypothetical protein OEW31_02360, partial [Thermoleophilia bacterium]|nr:hypothetical protein [Thermoleophilia bacterium]
VAAEPSRAYAAGQAGRGARLCDGPVGALGQPDSRARVCLPVILVPPWTSARPREMIDGRIDPHELA